LNITQAGNWSLFAETNNSIDFSRAIASGSGKETINLNNTDFQVYCFRRTEGSRGMLGLRQLPISGQPNFRDMGGYKTKEGKYVKYGKVFRSGKCNNLTNADIDYLASIPLKTVIDLRSNEEKEAEPDKVPATVTSRVSIPIDGGNLGGMDVNAIIANGDVESAKILLVLGNESFVNNNQAEYKKYFEVLQNADNAPLMFHCTAGKDRAGLAAALFLSALGVDKETVISDYLLTNTFTNATLENMQAQYGKTALAECMYYVFSVQRNYIEKAFEVIDTKYGGMDSFLKNQLNVDVEKMKELYLY
jgi:protein-tyrosine phosphatase